MKLVNLHEAKNLLLQGEDIWIPCECTCEDKCEAIGVGDDNDGEHYTKLNLHQGHTVKDLEKEDKLYI